MFNCHRPDFPLYLIANAEFIAKLVDFQGGTVVDIEIQTWYGHLKPDWFKKHFGHRLVPLNEYGRFLDSNGIEVKYERPEHNP
jgi:hypothetical protein